MLDGTDTLQKIREAAQRRALDIRRRAEMIDGLKRRVEALRIAPKPTEAIETAVDPDGAELSPRTPESPLRAGEEPALEGISSLEP